MLPKPSKRGRPRTDLRQVLDAIFYVVKGGIQWRFLPHDLPPWQTVYGIFRRWKLSHFWAALNDALRNLVRRAQGKRSQPTAAILDSQSVKSAGHGGPVGFDAGKRIKGRKRNLLVDTLGLVLGVVVTPADTTERDGGKAVLGRVLSWLTWLRLLWVDGGYTGDAFATARPAGLFICAPIIDHKGRAAEQPVDAGVVRSGCLSLPRPVVGGAFQCDSDRGTAAVLSLAGGMRIARKTNVRVEPCWIHANPRCFSRPARPARAQLDSFLTNSRHS